MEIILKDNQYLKMRKLEFKQRLSKDDDCSEDENYEARKLDVTKEYDEFVSLVKKYIEDNNGSMESDEMCKEIICEDCIFLEMTKEESIDCGKHVCELYESYKDIRAFREWFNKKFVLKIDDDEDDEDEYNKRDKILSTMNKLESLNKDANEIIKKMSALLDDYKSK